MGSKCDHDELSTPKSVMGAEPQSERPVSKGLTGVRPLCLVLKRETRVVEVVLLGEVNGCGVAFGWTPYERWACLNRIC